MCEPVSITMGVLGVVSAVSSSSAADKSARTQQKNNERITTYQNANMWRAVAYQRKLARWQEDNYKATAVSAQASATGQYAAVIEKVGQVRDRALWAIERAHRQSQKGYSFVGASASESGTTGSSVMLAQQQYQLAEARYTHNTYKNYENSLRQSERDMAGIHAHYQNIINRAMPAPMQAVDAPMPTQQVDRPSMAPYMLAGASSIIGATAYQQGIDAGSMDTADYAERWT